MTSRKINEHFKSAHNFINYEQLKILKKEVPVFRSNSKTIGTIRIKQKILKEEEIS